MSILSELPTELVSIIFDYVIKKPSDLMTCLLVCKSWYNWFHAQSLLWSKFDEFSEKRVFGLPLVTLSGIYRNYEYNRKSVLHYAPPPSESSFPHIKTARGLYLVPSLFEGSAVNYLCNVSIGSLCLDKDLVWCVNNLPDLKNLALYHGSSKILGITDCEPITELRSLQLYGNFKSKPISAKLLVDVVERCKPSQVHLVEVLDQIKNIGKILRFESTKDFRFEPKLDSIKNSELPLMCSPITSELDSLWVNHVRFPDGTLQLPLPLKRLVISKSELPPGWDITSLLVHYGCEKTLEQLELRRTETGCILPGHIQPLTALVDIKLHYLPRVQFLDGHIISWIVLFLPCVKNIDVTGCEPMILYHLQIIFPNANVVSRSVM